MQKSTKAQPSSVKDELSLPKITPTPKTGSEYLSDQGNNTTFSLFDFWRWSVSDLLSNATRGRLAEFIVASAVKLDLQVVRDEWGAFDITTPEGIKIEVKSAAYIQSWHQKSFSTISFSIKASLYWDADTNKQQKVAKRHADVYVFCHLKHQDQATIDPLQLEQWDFYVLPTVALDNYTRSKSSITLKSLGKLVTPCAYGDLRQAIATASKAQKEASKNQA